MTISIPPSPTVDALELSGFGYYSPGLECPAGYTTACHGGLAASNQRSSFTFQFPLRALESAIGCCPSSMGCAVRDFQICTAAFSGSNAPRQYVCGDTAVPQTADTLQMWTAQAPLVQLKWQSTDTATSTPIKAMASTRTATSASPALATFSTASSETPSPNHPSKAGDIAGGVVGGVAGLALVLASVYLFLRFPRRRSNAQSKSGSPEAATESFQKPELPGEGYHKELPGEREPGELGVDKSGAPAAVPVELEGA